MADRDIASMVIDKERMERTQQFSTLSRNNDFDAPYFLT
jgi:hypothetical protein